MDEDIWGNEANDEAKGKEFIDSKQNEDRFSSNKDSSSLNGTNTYQTTHSNTNNQTEKPSPFRYFSTGLDESENTDIRIVNTEERKGKITKYTVYILESDVFGANLTVARRYNDFKWLYANLGNEFLGPFIPPLPPSSVFERFKDEVVSQRRYDLERFLNRINNNPTLKSSQSFELFLCEQSEQVFEEQKKINKKVLSERSEYDIISLLMRNFENIDTMPKDEHLLGNFDDFDNDDTYKLDMPRVREFFMRCDERFTALNKITNNLFKIMANISNELNVLYDGLNELYDAEFQEQPFVIQSKCQQRWDVRTFMNRYKELEEAQTNAFYKYFMLNLRYEHEDIKSILDGFKRYDSVYNRYKKQKQNLKKQKDKYPDKDYSANETTVKELKSLLDLICKIILINDTPQIWDRKMTNYNSLIKQYIQNVTANSL